MPFIDFAEAKDLPEGVTPELLGNEAVQTFIKSKFDESFEKRFEIETSGLKKTNQELKDEKVKLKGFLDELKDIDVEEYKRLKELAKNNGDAARQIEVLEAEKEGIRETYEEKISGMQSEMQVTVNSLYSEQLRNKVAEGIREHNASFPAVAVVDGTERWVIEEAQKVWQRDEQGNYTPMNGDRVLTGPNGDVMTYPEWVNSLREQANFAPMFKVPTGGGARGGNGGSGGGHFNPSDLAGSKSERQAAISARFNLPN